VNAFELLVLLGLTSAVLVASWWLGHLVGVNPWVFALPPVVLGLRYVLLGSWWEVAVALGIGASLAAFTPVPWPMAVLAGAGAFYALCLFRSWRLGKRDPAGMRLFVGRSLLRRGHYAAAAEELTQALAVRPNDPAEAYFLRGLAWQHGGSYLNAIEDYGRALALNGDFTAAYVARGQAYSSAREYDRAIADFSRAIERAPDAAEAYLGRGLAREEQARYQEALTDHDRALALDRHLAAAYYHKAILHEQLGEPEQALAAYRGFLRSATRRDPNRRTARQRVQRLQRGG
jgi:tetratricopeptide (TPR) repeat protein